MKRSMGSLLIIVGVISLICGIVMVSSKEKQNEVVVQLPSREKKANAGGSRLKSGDSSNVIVSGNTVANDGRSIAESASMAPQQADGQNTATQINNEPSGNRRNASEANDRKKEMSSKEKGDEFEDFTVNLLADWRMTLLRRTQDKMSSNGVVAESCKEPDLHVQQKRGKSAVDYHLECKYRSRWTDNAVTFEEWQIKRYREFQRAHKRKVLIALGVGGTPNKPQTFMIVPIDSIKDNAIRKIDVNKYSVPSTSDGLAQYIDHYFNEVFAEAKRKSSRN